MYLIWYCEFERLRHHLRAVLALHLVLHSREVDWQVSKDVVITRRLALPATYGAGSLG